MATTPRPRFDRRTIAALVLGALSFAAATALAQPPPPPPRPPALPPGDNFGQPLPGLTDAQLGDFLDGRDDFVERRTAATGLGPIFNNVSCLSCHDAPRPGGASRITVTRFGRISGNVFDPLESLGGSLLQSRALNRTLLETIPATANVRARRLTTALFGDGLIEAIPDSAILANAAKARPAGIKGRVAYVTDPATGARAIGRFGWKAQHASILGFVADAFASEMGITNRLFPHENAPNGKTALIARTITGTVDDQPDPADGSAAIDRTARFIRYLAAPTRAPTNAPAIAGEKLFTAINCAACHTPSFTTGTNSVAALSRKSVPLYSDLLLHDMGALGDRIAQGDATGAEMRTTPLWGVRARPVWLHDGRARTLDQAIRAHAGEAQASRDAYTRLTTTQRNELIAFLRTL
jgi:CxxC motif-containing protein (DUF1111 family)